MSFSQPLQDQLYNPRGTNYRNPNNSPSANNYSMNAPPPPQSRPSPSSITRQQQAPVEPPQKGPVPPPPQHAPQLQQHAVPWKCVTCGATHKEGVICTRCFTHCPPNTRGYAPIFAGLRFHFNGIIQKSLLSQSFNKEWRMAQAHGAECTSEFDTRSSRRLTHLIYRAGYERSDKVRAAVQNPNLVVVPIEWMLDCMMAGKRLPEDDRRLKSIPHRALPLDPSAPMLEHHRHPFYVAHHEKFPEPSSSEVTRAKEAARKEQSRMQSTSTHTGQAMSTAVPDEIECDVVPMWPTLPPKARPLFAALRFLMSEGCPDDARRCSQQLGAVMVSDLSEGPTHLIYAPEDRKSPLVAHGILTGNAAMVICPLLWVQDCIQANEVLPNAGPYRVPAKLLQSLKKKKSDA